MARKARVQYEGAIYHVYNRGIDRRLLFWDGSDYQTFLDGLELGVERFRARVYAYGLMPNHFHLLVETPLGNLDRFMQGVQTRYAGAFNRRHGRSGYVYQGPYRAKLVEGDKYLLRLSRYIHLNPADTDGAKGQPLSERIRRLRAYAWTSYREYCGDAPRRSWMDYRPIEDQVATRWGGKRGAYRRFVESGLATNDEDLMRLLEGGAVCVGSEDFLKDLQDRLVRRSGTAKNKNQGFRRQGRYVAAAEVVARVCVELKVEPTVLSVRRGGAWLRGITAEMLCRYGGLTQVAAARRLGLKSGAAVCILRRELRERRRHDRTIDDAMRRIEAGMESCASGL